MVLRGDRVHFGSLCRTIFYSTILFDSDIMSIFTFDGTIVSEVKSLIRFRVLSPFASDFSTGSSQFSVYFHSALYASRLVD